MRLLLSIGLFALCGTAASCAWVLQQPTTAAAAAHRSSRQSPLLGSQTTQLHMSLLDALMGGNSNVLKPVKSPLPYGDPMLPVSDTVMTLAIQERGISFTGEDLMSSRYQRIGPSARSVEHCCTCPVRTRCGSRIRVETLLL
jgi:hypothetical protein